MIKRLSPLESFLRILTALAVAGALALTIMSGAKAVQFQTGLLTLARSTIDIIIGKGTALEAFAPQLLKLAFFIILALLIWSILLLKGTDRRSALVGGMVSVIILSVALEVLQFILPYRQPSIADFLWCLGGGCLTSFFLFLCQWAWDKCPALVNRETVLYVVFGAITTLVNILTFQVCFNLLHIETLIANAVAWVLSVLVAYITNKLFVFQSRTTRLGAFAKELGLFFGARLLSFAVDELGIWLMVDVAHLNGLISKIAMNVIVLILNYIFSKWFIFSGKKSQP